MADFVGPLVRVSPRVTRREMRAFAIMVGPLSGSQASCANSDLVKSLNRGITPQGLARVFRFYGVFYAAPQNLHARILHRGAAADPRRRLGGRFGKGFATTAPPPSAPSSPTPWRRRGRARARASRCAPAWLRAGRCALSPWASAGAGAAGVLGKRAAVSSAAASRPHRAARRLCLRVEEEDEVVADLRIAQRRLGREVDPLEGEDEQRTPCRASRPPARSGFRPFTCSPAKASMVNHSPSLSSPSA